MKSKHSRLRKAFAAVALVLTAGGAMTACATDKPADVASSNLSNAADNFRINRQINFVNTITGENLLTIQGLCSLGNTDKAGELSVTCKVGEDEHGNAQYIKDFLGLSPTVTYVVQQLGAAEVSSAHYSITWNPGALIPDFNSPGGAPLTPSQPSTSSTAPATGAESSKPQVTVKVVPVPGLSTPTTTKSG